MKLETEYNPNQPEIRVNLPHAPNDVSAFRNDLCVFSRNFKAGANLQQLEVIVTFRPRTDEALVEKARGELSQMLNYHFPERRRQAGEDKSGREGSMSSSSFKLILYIL